MKKGNDQYSPASTLMHLGIRCITDYSSLYCTSPPLPVELMTGPYELRGKSTGNNTRDGEKVKVPAYLGYG